jgi:hypothetical protein
MSAILGFANEIADIPMSGAHFEKKEMAFNKIFPIKTDRLVRLGN